MLEKILIGLFSSGLLLTGLGLYSRLAYWRGAYWNRDEDFKEVMNRAIQSEREAATLKSEMEFQKRTLTLIASRDSVAILTDGQVQHVVQSIAQLVLSSQKAPSQMN